MSAKKSIERGWVSPQDEHYSGKGGHVRRGKFWREQRAIEQAFGFHARQILPTSADTAQIMGRSMRRTPRSGRW